MTIFKSRQVNFDKTPWAGPEGRRTSFVNPASDAAQSGGWRFDPRPEFEPTCDPWPHLDGLGNRHREAVVSADPYYCTRWAPRREQFDTPVNRVLVDVRAERDGLTNSVALVTYYSAWEQSIGDPTALGYWTADEIEHARKVLTRLAAL